MKKIIFAVVITAFSLTLIAFSGKSVQKNYLKGSDTKINIPEYFYKRLEGTINNHLKIIMNLERVDTTLKGSYYYVKYGTPINFSYQCKIDKEGNVKIVEGSGYDKNYNLKITGLFDGKFISSKEIKGKWKNPNTKKSYDFNLIEKYPAGSAQFDYLNFSQKEKQGNNGKGRAVIYINYPLMKNAGNEKVQANINSYLDEALLLKGSGTNSNNKFDDVNDMINDFFKRYRADIKESQKMKMERDIYYGNYYRIDVLYNSDNLVSFESTISTFEGGAHPNTVYRFKNFDLKTGLEINLSDIFRGDYMSVLNKLGEERFRKHFDIPEKEKLDAAGFYFDKGIFRLNDNFSLNRKAITFTFNPYEVAAYAYGAPEIVIPYSKLRNIIKPGSIIAKYVIKK